MNATKSKPYVLRATIETRSLPIELFGLGRSRHQRKLVFNYIASYANADGSSACPSLTTIARHNGLSRRGAIGIVNWLEDHGLLAKAEQRSRFGTNNYTALFSPEDQEKCREALRDDAEEQRLSGRAKRTHEDRIRGGKRAAERRNGAHQSPASIDSGECIQSPSASECIIHQGSERQARVVNDELPASECIRSHDRPSLPSLNRQRPSFLPSQTSDGGKEGYTLSTKPENRSDKLIALLSDCLKAKGAARSLPTKGQRITLREEIETKGEPNTLLAFLKFLGRAKGVRSLIDPWSMFLNEMPTHLSDVSRERQRIGDDHHSEEDMIDSIYSELFEREDTEELFQRVIAVTLPANTASEYEA